MPYRKKIKIYFFLLIRQNLLLMTIPDKPRSSKQKYVINAQLKNNE
ncbi:Fic family protein [Megamonas hypermegale]|nr:hypothetical protein [Megamonas hypermegale]